MLQTHNLMDQWQIWIQNKRYWQSWWCAYRVYPAYGKRSGFGGEDNDIKPFQSSRSEDSGRSYSTKVYRNSSRKATPAVYERYMQPLTIATTGWTTSTSLHKLQKKQLWYLQMCCSSYCKRLWWYRQHCHSSIARLRLHSNRKTKVPWCKTCQCNTIHGYETLEYCCNIRFCYRGTWSNYSQQEVLIKR